MARGENRPSDFSELILLAVANHAREGAFNSDVFEAIELIGRPTSFGAVCATCDRLEERGWMTSHTVADKTTGRGRRRFSITTLGEQALKTAERERDAIRAQAKPKSPK